MGGMEKVVRKFVNRLGSHLIFLTAGKLLRF